MEIEYLRDLDSIDYNALGRAAWTNSPKSMTEISALEHQYNDGRPFPEVLRELLYIAGNGNPLIEFRPTDLQEQIRLAVKEAGQSIPQNYFAFDFLDFSSFSLVYTADNIADPKVYHVELYPSEEAHTEFIEASKFTLLETIKYRINNIKQGYNPF